MTASTKRGYLGIDNGTQGLTVLLVNENLQVIATGEATYGYVPNLPEGCYEQVTKDWEMALEKAIQSLREHLQDYDILGIGIAGQMHGHVLVNSDTNQSIGTVRLWCDARNQKEADEISRLFGVEIPKRCTIARWLWTIRNLPELAQQTSFLTTPAGWLSFLLTRKKCLGIGDASGMFPMDSSTGTYNRTMMQQFDTLVQNETKETTANIASIESLLPEVVLCGQDAGVVTEEAAAWLGLKAGIPVAAAEGDQPGALAGSLIGRAGMVSCSFGTSVCANLVGNRFKDPPIQSPFVNHFCAPNGEPIYMVWLRNGTTFFNSMVQSYGGDFTKLMPDMLQAPTDCGGLLAMPFMDDEPGFDIHQGGTAMIMGWNPTNTNNPGCALKAALLSTMFNLYKGVQFLQSKGVATTEVILTGGLTKTPACGQFLADVFGLPVRLLEGAEEGCSWGAAVLARYRYETSTSTTDGTTMDWPTFLESIPAQPAQSFTPNPDNVKTYQAMYARYQSLLALQPELQKVME